MGPYTMTITKGNSVLQTISGIQNKQAALALAKEKIRDTREHTKDTGTDCIAIEDEHTRQELYRFYFSDGSGHVINRIQTIEDIFL